MVHENVCAEATGVKHALFDICALFCECACASRACVCIACVGALYCTYARNIANLRTLTLFIAPRYQQACRITHVLKRKTLRRRSHCRGGSGLLS